MIPNGNYQIFYFPFSLSLSLDVPGGSPNNGVLIQNFVSHGGPNQQWTITHIEDNFYTIVNVATKKALDVPGGYPIPGLAIQQYTPHGGPNQQWKIETIPQITHGGITRREHHRIFNRHTGLALDVPNGTPMSRTTIQQYTPHNGWNQTWVIWKVI